MMFIKATVTLHNERANGATGEMWIKFTFPMSETAAASRTFLLTGKEVAVVVAVDGEPRLLGVGMYNGHSHTPDGETHVSVRSNVNNIVLPLQKLQGKAFDAMLVTTDEADFLKGLNHEPQQAAT
jgi:hypothetical protein